MTTSQTSGNRREEGGGRDAGEQAACAQCGTRHDAGQLFCDTCGAVLHWTPAAVAPPRAAAPDGFDPDAETMPLPDVSEDPAASNARPGAGGSVDGAAEGADAVLNGGPSAGRNVAAGEGGYAAPHVGAGSGDDPDPSTGSRTDALAGRGADGSVPANAASGAVGYAGSSARSGEAAPNPAPGAGGYAGAPAGGTDAAPATGFGGAGDPGADTGAGGAPAPNTGFGAGGYAGGSAAGTDGGPHADFGAGGYPESHAGFRGAGYAEALADAQAGIRAEAGSDAPVDLGNERARALLIPVDDPQGRPDRPPTVAPVLPGRPAPARPEVRAPGAPEVVGGVACPWCGTANQPDRHFCGRCAMSMARGPQDPDRRPWWRRLLDYRNREAPWAGDRPRLGRQLGRILRWAAGAVALVLVVVGLFHVDDAVQGVRDHFAKRAPVVPDSVTASHSYPKHGAQSAFDEVSNTWWGPGVSESGAGQWLDAKFQQPVRLLDIGITPGESTHADTLSQSALPRRIEARITMDNGHTATTYLTLDQGSGFQHRSFRYANVTEVRLTVESSYNTSGKKQVAIAEVEFFGPSHGG